MMISCLKNGIGRKTFSRQIPSLMVAQRFAIGFVLNVDINVTPAYSRGSNGCGCPNCAKIIRGVSKKKSSAKNNSLVKKYPDIAKEWHYEKNVWLKPQMVTAGSSKKVWWVCEKGHEWETFIYARKNGTGCPICYKESRK